MKLETINLKLFDMKAIATKNAPAAIGPYSQAIEASKPASRYSMRKPFCAKLVSN